MFRPERRSEVAAVLAEGGQSSYLARGLGRSYGDAALNAGAGIISGVRLDRFLGFDESSGMLDVEAGVSLHEILRVLLPRGFFFSVTPGTRFVTVGGAIAANVHGKNHRDAGAFGSFVEGLTLLVPSGEVLTCSASENADAFRATVGGMGLTGVILSARIRMRRVESAWMRAASWPLPDLDSLLEALWTAPEEHALAWVDCAAAGRALGRGVLARGTHASAEEAGSSPLAAKLARPRRAPLPPVAGRVGGTTIRAFNWAVFRRPRSGKSSLQPALRFFYPLDSLRDWNRLYGRGGMIQYQCVFPTATARQGVAAVLRCLADEGAVPRLSVLKRLGPAREGMLSFPMEGFTLALDLPAGGRSRAALRAVDGHVLDGGGRVYLAKDALLDPPTFQAMYPEADQFRAVRSRLDPDGRISSSLGRRVGLVDR